MGGLDRTMTTTTAAAQSQDKNDTKAVKRGERYAALLSQCRSREAHDFTRQVFSQLKTWQRESGKRRRGYLARSGTPVLDAVERFVGDLLLAKGDTKSTGRIFHSIGETKFDDVPVSYDVFMKVLEGLKALGLVEHEKGKGRFRKQIAIQQLPGRASHFSATGKLVQLAEDHGVPLNSIKDHYKPAPPLNPLLLRDFARGVGVHRERGKIIRNYKRTAHTKRLEADIRELNAFLAGYEFAGGECEHYGFTRNFNNRSWEKGGRLYSVGGGYQQQSEKKRLEMTINGEGVVEIDIKASFLTIYHARLGVPLQYDTDPYVEAGIQDRRIAKSWVVHSFGKSRPQTRWPKEAVKKYREETGRDLNKVAKAKDVAKRMLEAFPALKKLNENDYPHIWADLQFLEAEAILNTMLILMRKYRAPSLSMHDGIIVPRSRALLTKDTLNEQYREIVGVEPVLTAEDVDGEYLDGRDL
jgi:hypothetical protein